MRSSIQCKGGVFMDYTDAFILGALIGEYFGQDDED